MKKLVIMLALAAALIIGFQGTSHAVLGVVDDVPGTDVTFPIICEKGGTMNTLWTIADVLYVGASAALYVATVESDIIYDDVVSWTSSDPDALVGDCQSLVAGMSPVQQAALEMTIGGRDYYVGYAIFMNLSARPNYTFVPWVYLVDLTRGFASGFNGFAAEEWGLYYADVAVDDTDLCEYDPADIDNDGVVNECPTASLLFPRYFILNDKPETWNWWILMYGNNDPARFLTGYICNEDEDCISLDIPVPDELNIIDVEGYVPASIHAGYPKAGFGWFVNVATYYAIEGVLGWSYQRAEGDTVAATWDVIHPIHRVY